MSKYNLTTISRSFFPWFWQNTTNLALIDVLLSSLESVNTNIETAESGAYKKAGYSIQRLSLESSLNDNFDSDSRRILIYNGTIAGSEFVYNIGETLLEIDKLFVYNVAETEESPYIYNSTESSASTTVGFTVVAPSEISTQEQQIRAWIDFVLILGTNYTITYS